ncbi:MAG: phosphoribosylamine--glycine ligase [Candidatus Kerfeldbacteria bacterium]|nr:phosphoribosylamine--glycine ligase [Candidatus Kerfeldbacteria bacterium]
MLTPPTVNMNIVVIGSGAREHALVWKLAQHSTATLYNYGPTTNPGIVPLVQEIGIGDVTAVADVVQWCQERQVTIAWIGPEAPLAAGLVDALEGLGISCIGPTKKLAQLESSKSFTRQLLQKYQVPGSPQYQVFTTLAGVEDFIRSLNDAVVVKPDGLTGGKGVRVMGEQLQQRADAVAYCAELLSHHGQRVVVEEKLIGQEFSLMSMADGKNLVHLPPVQDHKRALNGDLGSNTGGMGSYSAANHSLPFLTAADIAAAQRINERTLEAIEEEFHERYKGIMYGGFMAVRDGVRLIEYNARFGDPEVMNIMAVLDTDLVTITDHILNGTLDQCTVQWRPQASVCKYVVPVGYPDQPVSNVSIDVGQVDTASVQLFYGAVDQTTTGLVMKGSRAIAVVAVADTITAAEQQVEQQIQRIIGPIYHRADIGTAALINQRVTMLKQLRHG